MGDFELGKLQAELLVLGLSGLKALLLVLHLACGCSLHSKFDQLVVLFLQLHLLKVYFSLQLFDSSVQH